MKDINKPDNTVILNEETIGITIVANIVVINGNAKNVIIQSANRVIFNDNAENTVIEYTKEIIDNKIIQNENES